MKKTVLQLLVLVLCITISPYSYGQKKKSIKVDSFYFESPNPSKNRFLKISKWTTDSLPISNYINYSNTLFNSEETSFSLKRSISLSNDSDSKEVPIEINTGSLDFFLSVNCSLQSGILTVEVYDPKGIKRGGFSVKESVNSNDKSGWSETVTGVINKNFTNPLEGIWILKFISKKVTADIMINTNVQ
ncbi:MAG: hypothetical protein ACI9Y7_000245 [Dokdonia sp.]|jgi:hypothetical protein